LAGLFLLFLDIAPAVAQPSCTISATNLVFGDVSGQILANQVVDVTGTINWSCSSSSNNTITICIAMSNFTGSVREMTSGGNTLTFQVYRDSNHTQIWGTVAQGNAYRITPTTNSSGNVSGTATMYGRIIAGQTTEPPGSYSRSMAGSSSQRLTATTSDNASCSSFSSGARQYSFTATATISDHCTVSATNLNFGTQGVLTGNVDQTSTINVQCTNTTPYNIGLNAGLGAGATVTTRKMTSGGNTIDYSLYRDTARSQVWGTTIGTNTVSATGTGATQSRTVYGRVPAQSTPAPAIYSDTITVTVTY
jgi:spore coat protein U-like protein